MNENENTIKARRAAEFARVKLIGACIATGSICFASGGSFKRLLLMVGIGLGLAAVATGGFLFTEWQNSPERRERQFYARLCGKPSLPK